MAGDCKGVYVTGTDTGCGKTFSTVAIMAALKRGGLKVSGMKPVASGCEALGYGRPENDDARRIRAACSIETEYEVINPWALADAVAPHIAARREGRRIEPAPIIDAYRRLEKRSQAIVVEGIGGWRVPLSETFEQVHLVKDLGLAVILVVGLRLGCISHARLTAEAIRNDSASLCGWIANRLDPYYDTEDETVDYLSEAIDAPLLGIFPHLQHQDKDPAEVRLDLEFLLKGGAI